MRAKLKIHANMLLLASVAALSGCATVRQVDLDSWKGMPVEALDTHSLFLTMKMVRTMTEGGVEIRNYINGGEFTRCYGAGNAYGNGGYVNSSAFSRCNSEVVACNNIFYIKDGKVLEYAPTGSCYTDKTVQPQSRYLQLQGLSGK